MLQTKYKSLIYSFIVMLLWGLLFPTVKLGYRVFGISDVPDILAFAGFRFVSCGAVIVAFAAIKNPKSFRAVKEHLGWVLLSSLFYLADVLILGASFCTVFSNVVSKKVFRHVEPIVSTGVSQLFGGVVLLVAGVLSGGNIGAVLPRKATEVGVFAVIVVASVISYVLWFVTVKKENLSKLFMIKFSEPLFAAVFAWMILGEDIWKINYLLAFIFISAGILVASTANKR